MTPGTKIGPYEITGAIGAGGMGEVYRARDPKLNRDVAIKVLPPAFAQDAERMARFQREAQVLAALNHPNIAQIYGMEGSALVMEFVPGDAVKGPLAVDDAMAIARQIADALEAAHEKGIVHRDLKPANIKVTPAGQVKVLDFGLAKAMDETNTDISNSPTLSIAATRAGVILGTASYMSPEQAKGKPVDGRADIWAYGCVLFELLTGKLAFPGETAVEAMAAIISREPEWSLLPPGSPVELLRLCLQKDPKLRLRHIGDSVFVTSEMKAAPAISPSPSASRVPGLAVAALSIVAVILAIGWYRATRPAAPRPLMHLNIEVGTEATLGRNRQGGMLAISPDGTRIAVTFRTADNKVILGTRLLSQSAITPLPRTDSASDPFFSADGQWIAFSAEGKLKKISVEGGAAVTICESSATRGASWGDDGNIVFSAGPTGTLVRVSSAGGVPAPLTKFKPGERSHRWPQVLPGSEAVLFTQGIPAATGGYSESDIEVVMVKTGERKVIQQGGFNGRYLPNGYLVYLHQSTLFAAPLTTTAPPVPVLEDVASNTTAGGEFAFSQGGAFLYQTGGATSSPFQICVIESGGKRNPLTPTGFYLHPRFSPDGKRVAFVTRGAGQGNDIWVKDLDRDAAPSRLTFLPGANRYPVWTPDGKNIIFESSNPGAPGIYWIRADGSGEAVRLIDDKVANLPSSVSPDGKRLAFFGGGSNNDLFTAAIEGDSQHPRMGKLEPFLGTPFTEVSPVFSPDGRWLAYSSDESGAQEIYVRPFPGPGGRRQISNGGGRWPVWPAKGQALFYITPGDHRIMFAGYTVKGDTFVSDTPRPWTEVHGADQGINTAFDVSPDGKRVVAVAVPEGEVQKPMTHLTLLLNFFDELKRKTSK